LRRNYIIKIILLCLSVFAVSSPSLYAINAILEEKLYEECVESIKKSPVEIDSYLERIYSSKNREMHSKIFMDALWDLVLEPPHRAEKIFPFIFSRIRHENLNIAEKIRLQILAIEMGIKPSEIDFESTKNLILKLHEREDPDRRLLFILWSYQDILMPYGFSSIYLYLELNFNEHKRLFLEATLPERCSISNKEIQDLINFSPDLSTFKNGRYKKSVKLFMFCRFKAKYPCMMIMKDLYGNLAYNEGGKTLWHLPSLGAARFNKPFNERNGNTPQGVYTIDSVMPLANKPSVYGKFRRIILNFIPPSPEEKDLSLLLPESLLAIDWWKESVIARDAGRNLFRIHGTGMKNFNPFSAHYPFVKTSGCVAMREGAYDDFIDQRKLLDEIMLNLNFTPEYKNETRILGLLYVIRINNRKKPVSLSEIEHFIGLY